MRKNTAYALLVVAILVVVGAFMGLKKKSQPGLTNTNSSPGVSSTGRYCGANGDLVNTMPIQSHRSYCLQTNASSVTPNQPADLFFQIVDDQGNTLKDFDVVHEKIMHVILVRKDLTNFQHIHPEFEPTTGKFTLHQVTVAADGDYRLFADFTPTSSPQDPIGSKLPVVDHVDLVAGARSEYQPMALGVASMADTVDAYQVSLTVAPVEPQTGQATKLTFTITENGKKLTDLDKYLGELGHAVVLKDGDLSFLHTHPMDQKIKEQDGAIAFAVTFPEPGRYKTFLQFQHRGRVRTVEFILPNIIGAAGSEPSGSGFHSVH